MIISNNEIEQLRQVERKACEETFYDFFLSFWDVVSKEKLVVNWHIPFLCNELQKLSYFIINRLPKPHDVLINIPPGTTKSTICTVMYPVWLWIKDPSLRIITNSHSATLSLEHATKSRDIIESDKFKFLFPDIELRNDKAAKGLYENTNLGARISTSTGSSTIGMHGHLIINDDPSDPKKSFSDADKDQVIEKIKELSTRKINKENTITLTIMQRLHEEDATGYILANNPNIYHICLPAEESKFIKPSKLKYKYVNGLLDPIRQSQKVLEDAKRELGSSKYSGQYDQMPTAKDGNIIKKEWFHYCTFNEFISRKGLLPIIFFGDTAYTEKKKNDPSGFIATCRIDNYLYILNAESVRKEFPELIKYLPGYLKRWLYTNESTLRIEPKASGKSVVQEIRRYTSINVVETEPPVGDKEERLNAASPTVEALRVILIEGQWNEEFVDQICGFPNKKHDEYVDLLGYAIKYHFNQQNEQSQKAYEKALQFFS